MRYLSTRDPRPSPATFSFTEVLLAGLAADGGLYVPDRLPGLGTAELTSYAGLPYAELSARLVSPFSGETFTANELRRLTAAAYSGFTRAAVVPLVQLDERLWLLELFHGPTLAFKDLALQLVGLMFDAVLARRQRAYHHRWRNLWRHRFRCARGMPRPGSHRYIHPFPA